MPEWLKNFSFSEVIAILGVLGGIVSGLVTLHDRSHRSTVANFNERIGTLSARIDYLTLLLAESRRNEAEAKAREAKIDGEKDIAERKLVALVAAQDDIRQYENRIAIGKFGILHKCPFVFDNQDRAGELPLLLSDYGDSRFCLNYSSHCALA